MTPAQTKLAAWYLRRGPRSLWLFQLSIGFCWVLALFILRNTFENPSRRIIESREAALALAPPEVPKASNAAEDYAAAQKAKFKFSGVREKDPSLYPEFNASAFFDDPSTEAYLKANAIPIASLLAGATKEKCNFDLDYSAGMAMKMPHLGQMRDSARLLGVYARSCAHKGDHKEAARAISAMLAMARHVETDPILIVGLVSISMDGLANTTLESILLSDPPHDFETLAAYRKCVWLDQHPFERAERYLEGEKIIGLYTMDMTTSSSSGGRTLPWYGSDRRCYAEVLDDLCDRLKDRAKNGIRHDAKMDIDDVIRRHQHGPVILSPLMLPALGHAVVAFIKCQEKALLLDTALAFLQFRARHKKDPASLDELVPEFMSKLPTGILRSGEPIHLRVDPRGICGYDSSSKLVQRHTSVIRLYMLANDGNDNGGYEDMNQDRPSDKNLRLESVVVRLPAINDEVKP